MIIIFLLLAIIGAHCYMTGKNVLFLSIVALLTFDFFGVVESSDYSKDAIFIMVIIILTIETIKNKHPLRIQKDPIAKAIYLMIGWIVIRYILTIIRGEETLSFGLKVIRHDFFFLAYFVFRQIGIDCYSKFFKLLIPIIVVVGLIASISLASGGFDEDGIFQRKTIMAVAAPLLFMLVTKELKIQFRFISIFLLLVFLGVTLARGFFVATCASIVIYFFLFAKHKVRVLLLMTPLVVLFYFAYSQIARTKEDAGYESAGNEITDAMNMSSYQEFRGGSFLLRFAMVWERGNYLFQNPSSLIMGVGAIHEDSPNNKFTFFIGSDKYIDDTPKRQMIDTDDVAMLSHWFRYGIVYIVLFVYFIIVCFRQAWRLREYRYMCSLMMLLFTMCLSAVSLDNFSRANRFMIALMLLSITFQYFNTSRIQINRK